MKTSSTFKLVHSLYSLSLTLIMGLTIHDAMSQQCVMTNIVSNPNGNLISAPPNTEIYYTASAPTTCTYSWSVTNGTILGQTSYSGLGAVSVPVKWNNVNGSGSLTVTTSSCVASDCDGLSKSITPNILYLGPIGSISFNGSNSSPQTLSCGIQTVSCSVGASTNATSYNWSVPSGWSINGGQGTQNINVTTNTNGGGNVSVTATRSGAPDVSSSTTLTINRPSPSGNSAQIHGDNIDNLICTGSTKTYTAIFLGTSAVQSWAVSSNLSIQSRTSNSINVSLIGSGAGYVRVYIADGCLNDPVMKEKTVWGGAPGYFDLSGPETICTNQVYNYSLAGYNSADPSSYSWASSSSAFSINGSGYGVNASTYLPGTYLMTVTASNNCGTATNSLGVDASSCFGRYSIYPNPAKDKFTIEAVNEKGESLANTSESAKSPQFLYNLFSDKQKAIREGVSSSLKVEVDIKDLSSGTYFLQLEYEGKLRIEQIVIDK